MESVLKSLQSLFLGLPEGVLQAWGLGASLVGWVLLVVAYGNLTLQPGGRWGLGWRRQTWDDRALKGVLITFVLILVAGYIGSHLVLVPGAQTFESLKDLAVFVCLMVFGYPALLIVPAAYGLSDLVEGVPPDFLLSWLPGYWINPSCFWLGVLLLGKTADFRTAATWGRYGLFVAAFLAVEPALWGWIAAAQFPGGLSYYQITPALFFTTAITWVLAPPVLFFLLPWAKQHGWLWSLRPGSVREYDLTRSAWVWESGADPGRPPSAPGGGGIPIRLALAVPVLLLLFTTVGVTAFVGLATGTASSSRLAEQLHQEQSRTIALELDNWFEERPDRFPSNLDGLEALLASASSAWKGRAYLLGPDGALLVTSSPAATPDLVLQAYRQNPAQGRAGALSFEVVTAQPMSRETWMARTTAYHRKGPVDWTIVIALPASVYLEGVQSATSQSAVVLTWALIVALLVVVLFTSMITAPVDKMARTARAMADGVATDRVPGSRIHEINVLTQAFNAMEDQILASMERLRASESQFRDILNGSLEGFFRTTPAGRVVMVNPAMAEILGHGSVDRLMTEVQDVGLQIWAHPEDRVQVLSVLGDRGQIRNLEAELLRADGTPFWGLISARMVHRATGEEPYLEGFLLDITDRKRADLELNQHREHLEVMVERRTQELVEARDAANRASQSKSVFLSNMSHEIRSPMNAVLGFAQLLNHETLSEPARAKVRTILNSGEHLMTIIDEILEMARIESGRVEVRAAVFDLRQVCEEVAALFRLRAAEKGLTLTLDLGTDLPASLVGDQGKVRQVVTNLVSNAVKYTSQGSVTVRAEFQGGLAVVAVEDTGQGLSADEQVKVFEPFERTAQGEATTGGTGLGLSICRRYAALMGGRVTVSSQKGTGSRFVLEFPATAGEPVASQALALPQFPKLVPGQAGRRILVVDDLDLNRELLRAFLEPLGLVVDEASSGQEALARAEAQPPSVVLLDLRMPGWNGFETTRRLRALAFGPTLTILGVSASAFDQDRKEFLDSGLDGFLAKPFREADLYAILADKAGFRFEEGGVPPRPHQDAPGLDGVDGAWADALRAAVAEGSPSHIKALVARLGPDHEALRLWLTERVGRYDLEAIQRLFDPRGT